jgi:hypothetical protein
MLSLDIWRPLCCFSKLLSLFQTYSNLIQAVTVWDHASLCVGFVRMLLNIRRSSPKASTPMVSYAYYRSPTQKRKCKTWGALLSHYYYQISYKPHVVSPLTLAWPPAGLIHNSVGRTHVLCFAYHQREFVKNCENNRNNFIHDHVALDGAVTVVTSLGLGDRRTVVWFLAGTIV